MQLHYLNEPVKYIADVKPEDRDNYIFTWYFDNKTSIVGPEVSYTWNDVGDHTIKLVTYDKKTGLSGYKFTTVNVVLRNVKHSVPLKCYEALARIARLERSLNFRTTTTITLSAATGTVDLGKTFEILDESASAAGRFRLYRTTAGRDADLARLVTTSAPNNAGLLLEDVFLAAALSVAEDPAPCSAGSDGLCAWSWSGDLGSTVTLDLLVLEAN